MAAGAPLQEVMKTRKVDDQVGGTGGVVRSCNPEGEKATGAPPEVKKDTQEEPTHGDPLHAIRLVTQGGSKVL